MILQNSHIIVDCPICGRPAEVQSQLVNHEIVCGHCRGEFMVHETNDGSLTTTNLRGTDPLKRAEQLLRVTCGTGLSALGHSCQQRLRLVSGLEDDETRLEDFSNTLPEDVRCEEQLQPTVLLVEHRDEVFARLATDMAEFGMRVIRAKSSTEAVKLCDTYEPTLLVGNVDLPDQNSWLTTAKLRLFSRQIRVWLYQHQASYYGREIAKFLGVDAPLTYQGDLLSLSETIVNLMAGHKACDAVHQSEAS